MSEVFLSYRQTDDAQLKRVRAFGERIRDAGITVILDQFFLDEKPGGPDEGWPKWSSDCAFNTEYVLIIGTNEWFLCFENKQRPGMGLGAACEANNIRTRIYEAAGVIRDIRVVLFDDEDEVYISSNLRPYHHFHAERDFENIVRWLRGPITRDADDTPRTSIPHNLPSLQPFFGREEELDKIADALDPESRTWGAVIDGPGGMGKTSLAIRAAYNAPSEDFDRIVFISLKSRELDDDGVRDLSGFLISGLAELLNELARELDHPDIAKAPEKQRPRMLLDVLRGTRTLLILDNLEGLLKTERDIVFNFVKVLPAGCKAILTSRVRIGSAAEELIIEKLSQRAALATLEKFAESNPALAKTSEAERLLLYRETGGKPLLLRWTAGQIGRGRCLTLTHAIAYLRSCPDENDPLEFIFQDLLENFTEAETKILCALTYFTLPPKVEHVAELAEFTEKETERTLRGHINRSLVVANGKLKTFSLVPLVADFMRKKNPEVVIEIGDRLQKRAYDLVVENGYENYESFPVIEAAWPTVSAALQGFIGGPNERLQIVCTALSDFLDFTGRWDEWLALSIDAEERAVAEQDFMNAGQRAYYAGWVHRLRAQPTQILACADRAEMYWRKAQSGIRERARPIHLRGLAHGLANDYSAARAAFTEALELFRTLSLESKSVAVTLNDLAEVERLSGDFVAAERDYREALRIARAVDYFEGVAFISSNLAAMALDREDWPVAESMAKEALLLSQEVGRTELIAANCYRLARALLQQNRKAEALPHARRAVEIFSQLSSPHVEAACEVLADCES